MVNAIGLEAAVSKPSSQCPNHSVQNELHRFQESFVIKCYNTFLLCCAKWVDCITLAFYFYIMGIVIRQSIKSTVWAYFGVLLGAVTTLWLYPHYLTTAQIGLTTGVLLSLASILSQIALVGTPNSLFFFSSSINERNTVRSSFLGFMIQLAFSGFLLVSLAYVLMRTVFIHWYQAKSALFLDYFWYVLPFTFFVVGYNLIEAHTRSQKDIVFTNFTREVLLRLLNIGALFLFALGIISFKMFVVIFVCSYGVLLLILLIHNRNKPYFGVSFTKAFTKFAPQKEVLRYGFYNVLAGGAWTIANSIDSLMLAGQSAHGLNDAGIYRIAYFICSVVQMPQRTITQILLPLLAEHWRDNDLQKIEELYQKSSLQLIIAAGFLVVLLVINLDTFLLQLPPEYQAAKWVVILLCLSKMIDMATSINGEIIQTSKYYRFNLYLIFSLLILTIVCNYFFIPMYGIIGAAIATTLANVLFNVVKYSYVYFRFHIQPFNLNTLKAVVLTLLVGVSFYFIQLPIHWMLLSLLKTGLASGAFILSLYALKISPEINQLIEKAWKKVVV